jgi:acetyl-CoA carboxylase carboxyltransferase component
MCECEDVRNNERERERGKNGKTKNDADKYREREREREIMTWRERMREILRESKTESFLEVEIVRQI